MFAIDRVRRGQQLARRFLAKHIVALGRVQEIGGVRLPAFKLADLQGTAKTCQVIRQVPLEERPRRADAPHESRSFPPWRSCRCDRIPAHRNCAVRPSRAARFLRSWHAVQVNSFENSRGTLLAPLRITAACCLGGRCYDEPHDRASAHGRRPRSHAEAHVRGLSCISQTMGGGTSSSMGSTT